MMNRDTYEQVRSAGAKLTAAGVIFLVGLVATAVAEGIWPLKIRFPPLALVYVSWAVLQGATVLGVIWLLVSPDARKVHMSMRLRDIFRYAARGWLVFLAFRLGFAFSEGIAWPGVVVRVGLMGLVLAGAYRLLQGKYQTDAESMFP